MLGADPLYSASTADPYCKCCQRGLRNLSKSLWCCSSPAPAPELAAQMREALSRMMMLLHLLGRLQHRVVDAAIKLSYLREVHRRAIHGLDREKGRLERPISSVCPPAWLGVYTVTGRWSDKQR